MPVVQTLVDVIQKGHTREDRCTNALVWLLQRCSPATACELLALAGLSLETQERVQGHVQWDLAHSRPDAVLEFPGPLHIVVETKIHPGMCSLSQLRNHLHGAAKHFGRDCTKLLFLSVERSAPTEVRRLAARFPGRVFFLAWQEVLLFLSAKRAVLDHEQQVYVEEFLACIRAERLWRLFPMTTDELKAFLAHFPEVWSQWSAAENHLNALLRLVCTRAVASSSERAEEYTAAVDDFSREMPCLYATLKIRNWHTTASAYVFVDAALGKAGVVLTGYQDDRKEKERFLGRWHASFKSAFAADPVIRAFVWEEEDEISGEGIGYFKPIDGTAGQVFDPSKIEAFSDYYYWGYWHDLDVSDPAKLSQLVADDFRKLLANYGPAEKVGMKKVPGAARPASARD